MINYILKILKIYINDFKFLLLSIFKEIDNHPNNH